MPVRPGRVGETQQAAGGVDDALGDQYTHSVRSSVPKRDDERLGRLKQLGGQNLSDEREEDRVTRDLASRCSSAH